MREKKINRKKGFGLWDTQRAYREASETILLCSFINSDCFAESFCLFQSCEHTQKAVELKFTENIRVRYWVEVGPPIDCGGALIKQ